MCFIAYKRTRLRLNFTVGLFALIIIGCSLLAACSGSPPLFKGINAIALPSGESDPPHYLALVIGNQDYAKDPLLHARKDAEDVAKLLEQRGYDVTLKTNLETEEDFLRAVQDFSNKLKRWDDAVALFYYSGHGMGVDRVNYLIPTGASVIDHLSAKTNAVNLDDVKDMLNVSKSRSGGKKKHHLRLMILDACRNDPFDEEERSRGSSSTRGGFAKVNYRVDGTIMFFSTSAGTTAKDGKERELNSPFADAFLQSAASGISFDRIAASVTRKVLEKTDYQQEPWVYASIREGGASFPLFPTKAPEADTPIHQEPPSLASTADPPPTLQLKPEMLYGTWIQTSTSAIGAGRYLFHDHISYDDTILYDKIYNGLYSRYARVGGNYARATNESPITWDLDDKKNIITIQLWTDVTDKGHRKRWTLIWELLSMDKVNGEMTFRSHVDGLESTDVITLSRCGGKSSYGENLTLCSDPKTEQTVNRVKANELLGATQPLQSDQGNISQKKHGDYDDSIVTPGKWYDLPPMPTGRRTVSVAAVNGKIYAIGGLAGDERINTVEEFDPLKRQWTNCGAPAPENACTPMPTKRSGTAVAVVGNEVYVLGGRSAPTKILANVEAYNVATNTWTIKRAMPSHRSGLTASNVNGKIYAIGGDWSAKNVEVYDPSSDTWSSRHPMLNQRESMAASVVGNKIYFFGGLSVKEKKCKS